VSSLIPTHTHPTRTGEKEIGRGEKGKKKPPGIPVIRKKKLKYQIRRNRCDSSATTWHKHSIVEKRTRVQEKCAKQKKRKGKYKRGNLEKRKT
jgi:hypothetical protein